jgi:Beta xylosidase C-terminal Concanavalin A-like domain/Secretion system C-terminal sorting domain
MKPIHLLKLVQTDNSVMVKKSAGILFYHLKSGSSSLRTKYKAVLFLLFLFPGILNSLSAQVRYNFIYNDRVSLLADGWDFIALTRTGNPRNSEQTSGAVVSYDQQVHPGVIRIPVDEGDLWEGINNTRNTLFRSLPAGWTSIRLKIASFDPSQNNQQATLAAYQDDDNYVQISRTFEGINQIMFTSESEGKAVNLISVPETATTAICLRLDRDSIAKIMTSYYSTDGQTWIKVGDVSQTLDNPRLAIETGASPGGYPNADFEWAEVSTLPLPQAEDKLNAFPGSLVFSAREGEESRVTRSVFISTSKGNIIRWNQSSDVPWLAADLKNGVTDGIVKVSALTAGLKAGIYQGSINLESSQSVTGPVTIAVTLIINPEGPVEPLTWKDGKAGAMSVSVDDGQPSAFYELNNNNFKGTYVTNGSTPPSFYSSYSQAGMELGSHLINHPCAPVSDDDLVNVEILPNLSGLCTYTPVTVNKIITLVWPCGYTNYREQDVAYEYFLSARGYNINKLEDSAPENFMNLRSYNSHEHPPYPPSDLKTVVDSAVLLKKWFNLVLHNLTNDDGAISYAGTKDIWVAPIGTVIKYILQRDRFIMNGYSENSDQITFNVSRLALPVTASRNFEEAVEPDDITTLKADIDADRMVENVLIDGVKNQFHTGLLNGRRVLLFNIRLEPGIFKKVEVVYRDQPVIKIMLSSDTLNFNTLFNRNPPRQSLYIMADAASAVRWSSSVSGDGTNWGLKMSPASGLLNDTVVLSVDNTGLPAGNYRKSVTISSPDNNFYPVNIDINLKVNPIMIHQNYPNPFTSYTWIEFDLPEDGPVTIDVYNSKGDKMETLVSRYMMSGNYKIKWDSRNFAGGIYFLSIRTKSYRETIKMSLSD